MLTQLLLRNSAVRWLRYFVICSWESTTSLCRVTYLLKEVEVQGCCEFVVISADPLCSLVIVLVHRRQRWRPPEKVIYQKFFLYYCFSAYEGGKAHAKAMLMSGLGKIGVIFGLFRRNVARTVFIHHKSLQKGKRNTDLKGPKSTQGLRKKPQDRWRLQKHCVNQ